MKANQSQSNFLSRLCPSNSFLSSTICLLIASCFLFGQTTAYDDSIKECWSILLQNETYFCYGAVDWPISSEVYYDQYNRDERARYKYNDMKRRWEGPKTKTRPSDDCFAIARSYYCSYEFPVCKDDKLQQTPMCDYICALWKFRCPNEPQCIEETSDKICSGALNGFGSSIAQTAVAASLAFAYMFNLI